MTDSTTYYRNQIAAYTDAIRISDFKANVAIIYGAFTIGPVLAFSDKFPVFLPMPVVILPFVVVFFFLLVCLMPRYPREGRTNFIISLNADPDDFRPPADSSVTLDQQQLLCVMFCRILFWKTVCLRISFTIYLACTVIAAILLNYYWFLH